MKLLSEIGSDSELSSESDEDYDELERKFLFIYTVVYAITIVMKYIDTLFDELIHTKEVVGAYHPFPSKAASLMYLLTNSPAPIVRL